MNSRKIVLHETLIVLVGELIFSAIMVAVFAALGKFSAAVLLGALAGTVLAVGNFLVMALVASKAADKAQEQDVAGGKKLVQFSYMGRLVGLFVLLFLLVKTGLCDPFALVLPLAFVRPTLTAAELFRKKGEKQA